MARCLLILLETKSTEMKQKWFILINIWKSTELPPQKINEMSISHSWVVLWMWGINKPCPWQPLLFPLLDKTSPVQGSALHLAGENLYKCLGIFPTPKIYTTHRLISRIALMESYDNLGWKSLEGEWVRSFMWGGTSLKAPLSHSPLHLWALLIQRTTIFSLGKKQSSYTFHPRVLALHLGKMLLN